MDFAMRKVSLGGLEVSVWLHNAAPPNDASFTEAMREVELMVERVQGDVSRVRSLVITDGGAPNTAQRAQIKKAYHGHPVKMAAFVAALENPILRGVAAALRWFNPNFMVYGPSDWRKGLEYLDIAKHEAEVLAVYAELQKLVGATRGLRAILERNVLTK